MNKFLKRYISKKNYNNGYSKKFTLTKFSLCIKFHKELSIMFLSWTRVLADSASTTVSIPTFDNGFETIEVFWSFYMVG